MASAATIGNSDDKVSSERAIARSDRCLQSPNESPSTESVWEPLLETSPLRFPRTQIELGVALRPEKARHGHSRDVEEDGRKSAWPSEANVGSDRRTGSHS